MVLIVLRGLNAQNNEEQLLFDKKNLGAEKMGSKRLIRVSEQHYNLAWIFFVKHYGYFYGW